MEKIFSLLNTREQSLAIWMLILLIVSFSSKSIRPSLVSLIKAFFVPRILIVLLLGWTYIILILLVANRIGWWNFSMIKDTFVWMFAVIFLLIKTVKSRKIKYSLLEIFKDVIQPIVIVEFIINLNTFDLILELILLPIFSFIILLKLISESEPKYRIVMNFINSLLMIWGLYILIWSVFQVFSNFNLIDKHQEGLNFFLPIWLTLLFLPYLYLIIIYSNNEDKLKRK